MKTSGLILIGVLAFALFGAKNGGGGGVTPARVSANKKTALAPAKKKALHGALKPALATTKKKTTKKKTA